MPEMGVSAPYEPTSIWKGLCCAPHSLGLWVGAAPRSSNKVTVPGVNLGGGISSPSASASDTKFAAWPGATLRYPMGSAFIGADARFLVVSDFNAFRLFATAGAQF